MSHLKFSLYKYKLGFNMIGMEHQNETPIEKAVRLAGGQTSLAKELHVTPQAVQQWVVEGRPPVKRAKPIAKIVNEEVTAEELRPDIFGEAEEDSG